MVLAELERKTGRPICKLFDLIAGTSTGGVLALALTKPDAAGSPEFSAARLIELYELEGDRIFSPAWHRWPIIGFLYDLFFVRYSARRVERVLRQYFGDTRLSRSEEHTSELQSRGHLVCRLLLEKKKKTSTVHYTDNKQI